MRARLADQAVTKSLQEHRETLVKLFAGRTPEKVFFLSGICPYTEDLSVDPVDWMEQSLAELATQAGDAVNAEVFRPLALNYNPCGVHFVDNIFGADVFWHSEKGGWQAHYLPSAVGALRMPDLEASEVWGKARRFAHAFVAADVPNVVMGLPTLSSPLNIAVNLYGQNILEAILAEPEAAVHDLGIISRVINRLHRWYRENVPEERSQCIIPAGRHEPPGYGQLCGCTTQLLSPAQYDRFVGPLDASLLAVYPWGGMIHLCGTHAQHIPAWRAMSAMRAVQLNDRAADDLSLYFAGLRPDQVLYVNPYQGMPAAKILQITGGRRTVICAMPEGKAPRIRN